jgi:glutathione synthase/RimK-type ligase-like ATP-grasp enzyme
MLNAEKANLYQHNILDAEQAESQAQAIKALGINLIINTIACADRMAIDLAVLEQFQQLIPEIPVINPPDKVLLTTREKNYQRLNAIANVVFPKTVKVLLEQQAAAKVVATMKAAVIEFPIIMRPCITHTGAGVELIHNRTDLQWYLDKHKQSVSAFYIIQYYQLANITGVFNKIRTFCIDGKYYPVACIFDRQWNIHSGDRYNYMANSAESQQREQSYFADMNTFLGDKAIEALDRIREIVELDFFGVDFTLLPDGKILIFECNAAMRHNFDHAQNFPYTYEPLRNVSLAFEQMLHQRAC